MAPVLCLITDRARAQSLEAVVERLARKRERIDIRFQARTLRRAGFVGREQTPHFLAPAGHFGLGPLRIDGLVHRVVHRAAEIPYGADGAPLIVGQD